MNFSDIFAMTPINRDAARIVYQRNPQPERDLSRRELAEIWNRLTRKQRLLKRVLKITSKAQHTNLMNRMAKGIHTARRMQDQPRSVIEYRRIGIEIQRFQAAIAEIRIKNRAEELRRNNERNSV